jgi:uncharacterized protein with HEPN domain
VTGPARPERRTLLELDALLGKLERLAAEGDRELYDADERYRWVIHRLWIAAGNEAAVLEQSTHDQTWSGLRKLRNELAHQRLPDIDEDAVWRMTSLRPASLRAEVRELLR